MKYFLSHCEYITRAAAQAARNVPVQEAIEALANIKLAEEDEQLPNPALVQCSDLYMELVEAGACRDGLTVVGLQCDEDTLDRVFAHRPDWQDWYWEYVSEEGGEDYDEEPYPHFDTLDEVNA
jgi:hypothetical protein